MSRNILRMCVITMQQRFAHSLGMRVIKVPSVVHILFGMSVTRLAEQLSSNSTSVYII
jgi:hypothetical protein